MPSTAAQLRAWRQANPEKYRAQRKRHYEAHRAEEILKTMAREGGRLVYVGRIEVCPECGTHGYARIWWEARRKDGVRVSSYAWNISHYRGTNESTGKPRYSMCAVPFGLIDLADFDRDTRQRTIARLAGVAR